MHIIHGEQGDVMHSHHHEHEHGENGCPVHKGEGCPERDGAGCAEGCCHPDETVAVLTYMLDHNEHHAAELESMAAELRRQGKTAAADMIDKGVVDFQTANMRLKVALSMLKEEA